MVPASCWCGICHTQPTSIPHWHCPMPAPRLRQTLLSGCCGTAILSSGRAVDDQKCCHFKFLLSKSQWVSKQAVHSLFQTPWKTPGKIHSELWQDDRSFSETCKTVFFFLQLPQEFLVRRGSRQWCPSALPLQSLCLTVFAGHLPVT